MNKRLFAVLLFFVLLGFNLIRSVGVEALPPSVFEDDFESYDIGVFPYGGGWELWWSGMGTEYQVVVENVSVSPTKSLQLWGGTVPGIMAVASKPVSDYSTMIHYESYVRVEDIQGEDRCVAVVGFAKSVSGGVRWYATVEFLSDGIVYTGGRGAGGEQHALQSYEADRWYKAEALLNKSNNQYSVWIDNQFMGEFTTYFDSSEIEAFSLGGGRANIHTYFDDVKLSEVHTDVAATNITLYKSVICQEHCGNITVTVENQGDTDETFDVTLYADNGTEIIIGVDTIFLASGDSTDLVFDWDTSGFSKGDYTIIAEAETMLGEVDTEDNRHENESIRIIVSMVGDITGPGGYPDGECDMRDVGMVAGHFGLDVPPAPANCDVTGSVTGVPDGTIDMRDSGLVARYFGETDP